MRVIMSIFTVNVVNVTQFTIDRFEVGASLVLSRIVCNTDAVRLFATLFSSVRSMREKVHISCENFIALNLLMFYFFSLKRSTVNIGQNFE